CQDKLVREAMQAYAPGLASLIGDRTQVDILSLLISPDQLYANLDKLLDSVRQGDLQDFTRAQKPLVMLTKAEEVDLLILLVPVAADAFKTAGPVSEPMCPYRDHAL